MQLNVLKQPIMVILFFLLVCGSNVDAQETPAPYIYYYSDIVHSFVIERADGSDSRQFATNIIPELHNVLEGAGWSPSGQWFAFTSSIKTYDSSRDYQSHIISTDEQSIISLSGQISSMMWSPTGDLLLYVESTDRENRKIVLFDPDTQETLFEYTVDGSLQYFRPGAYWIQDGSVIAWMIRRDGHFILYNLAVADLTLTEITFDENDQIIYDENDRYLLFTDGEEHLVIHDIFSHHELRYDLEFSTDTSNIQLIWNSEKTETFISVTDYIGTQSGELYIFWISLQEERIESIYRDSTGEDSCNNCIYWNSGGDGAVIQTYNKTFAVKTPSLHQIVPDTAYYRFELWVNDNQALFQQFDPEDRTTQTIIVDTETGEIEPVDFPINISWRGYLSISGDYLLLDYYIYSTQSYQIMTRSQINIETFGSYLNSNENADLVIFARRDNRTTSYETVDSNSTHTRELTTCYRNLCLGWLPSQVESRLLGDSSTISIIPEPVQRIRVDKPIEQALWNKDGIHVHVISADREEEHSTFTIWDITTAMPVIEYEIPYCQSSNCVFEEYVYNEETLQNHAQTLSNEVRTLQVSFDLAAQTYNMRDLVNDEILETWTEERFRFFFKDQYTWIANTLIFIHPTSGYCTYWHQETGLVFPGVPNICVASPNRDYALVIPIQPVTKPYLLDTVTGEQYFVNFYGTDGDFSPDSRQISLSSAKELTIWNVDDIVSIK